MTMTDTSKPLDHTTCGDTTYAQLIASDPLVCPE